MDVSNLVHKMSMFMWTLKQIEKMKVETLFFKVFVISSPKALTLRDGRVNWTYRFSCKKIRYKESTVEGGALDCS